MELSQKQLKQMLVLVKLHATAHEKYMADAEKNEREFIAFKNKISDNVPKRNPEPVQRKKKMNEGAHNSPDLNQDWAGMFK